MEDEHIWTVTDLNASIKTLLESQYPAIWVEAELSNLTIAASGHWYFSLKDSKSQVRCAMFRPHAQRVKGAVENGQKVMVEARVSLYGPRGDYQLIVQKLKPSGLGDLMLAYEALKAKLDKEGAFSASRKRPLPSYPSHIGVITSPSGAAIHDVLTTLRRRYPAAKVTVIPSLVQGEASIPSLREAIQLSKGVDLDVLIIGRGGGSIEDLWAFNDEQVARDLMAYPVPTVSAVGHETDFTICDFVCDVRAPTPTGAAELCSPNRDELLADIRGYAFRFQERVERLLETYALKVDRLEAMLVSPQQWISQQKLAFQRTVWRIHEGILTNMKTQNHRLSLSMRTIEAISPMATLERGYAIVENEKKEVIRSTDACSIGETIRIRLQNGQIEATTQRIEIASGSETNDRNPA